MIFLDVANIIAYDWMQMGLMGVFALIAMVGLGIHLGIDNMKRIPNNSLAAFVNLAGLAIFASRFCHGLLDMFWIGRGVTLATFMGLGMIVWVRLWLDQQNLARQGSNRTAAPRRVSKVAALK